MSAVTMNRGLRAHTCDQCNKSFPSTHQLAQHSRVHTGEKPYSCSYCDRRFKQLSHVQQHIRLHTGERPYKCSVPQCGRTFIQLSNLQQHMKTHSSVGGTTRSTEKQYFCNQCGKGFKGQSSLITHHSKKHEGLMIPTEKVNQNNKIARQSVSHHCQTCGKSYLNESCFRKHLESHQSDATTLANSAGGFPLWPCQVCATVFASEYGLLSHMEQMRNDPRHELFNSTSGKKRNSAATATLSDIVAKLSDGALNGSCQQNAVINSMNAHVELDPTQNLSAQTKHDDSSSDSNFSNEIGADSFLFASHNIKQHEDSI